MFMGKMVKQWHLQIGYQKRVRRLPFRWANSVTTPSISTALCLCVCAELQENFISSRSLTPLYRFLQSIDRTINDEGNTNTKTPMQCEKFSSHPNLMIKMLTGNQKEFPRHQQYTWAYVHNYLDAMLLVCTVQLSYYEVPRDLCVCFYGDK